jgi:hypothetical protein
MSTAYKSKGAQPDKSGWYKRDIGTPSKRIYCGKIGQITEDQFHLRRAKLESFWNLIVGDYQAPKTRRVYSSGGKNTTASNRPEWTPFLHAVAVAIGKGETEFVVEKPEGFKSLGPSYFDHVARLNAVYGSVMTFRPADPERADEGRKTLRRIYNDELSEASARINGKWQGRAGSLQLSVADLENYDPTKLHKSLDEYAESIKVDPKALDIETKQLTQWGKGQLKTIERFKDRHEDMPIGQLNIVTIRKICDYWRSRPLTVFKKIKGKKREKKPIACSTARHHIWQFKDFCRWLGESPNHRWPCPPQVKDIPLEVPQTPAEQQRIVTAEQVQTYKVKELVILYKTMTDLERCYLLLGLNCGFALAEHRELMLDQIFLHEKHPHAELIDFKSTDAHSWIRRVRGKSGVYGEWLLWPETVRAIEWALVRRRKNTKSKVGPLFITQNGQPYSKQRMANMWEQKVMPRVLKSHPDFKKLPPKCLRKTSGNMIRDITANAEIMGIFHSRGKVCCTDDLAEIYSNRPWRHVFSAIEKMHERLKPLWDAVPDAFA